MPSTIETENGPVEIVFDTGADRSNEERAAVSVVQGDDISKKTRETIGSYIKTKLKVNQYKPSVFTIETNIETSTVYGTFAGEGAYVDVARLQQHESYNRLGYPGTIDRERTGDAGKVPASKVIADEPDGTKYVDQLLKSGANVYRPDIARGVDENPALHFTNITGRSGVDELTKRDKDPTLGIESTVSNFLTRPTPIRQNTMLKIGSLLSQRAAGKLDSNEYGYDPEANSAGNLLPGAIQMGILKANVDNFNAKEALARLYNAEQQGQVSPKDPDSLTSYNSDSYGSMNTTEEPFDGLVPIAQATLAYALLLGSVVSIFVLTKILSLIPANGGGSKWEKRDITRIGRRPLGENVQPEVYSGFKLSSSILNAIGITPTVNPLDKAVEKGMAATFGMDSLIELLNPLGQLPIPLTKPRADSIANNPGYYIVFFRMLFRSANQIGTSIGNIADSFSITDPLGIVEGIGAIMNVIKSSKIIAVINIFGKVGDAELERNKDSLKSVSWDVNRYDDGAQHVAKSYLRDGHTLAWAQKRAAAIYLMPQAVLGAGVLLRGIGGISPELVALKEAGARNNSSVLVQRVKDEVTRIDVETREAMEKELDSHYFPFYFHDLRTNEIMSFHAFVTSLTDSYAAQYESNDMYGRVDSVKIYKTTARKINMSFWIVATSESDFDEMWLKINKLTTLVYPQWTKGDVLSSSDKTTIVQPFTQVPATGPLVRIRFGDLIRSNYTKFALARLFGAGMKDFAIEGEKLDAATAAKDFQEQSDVLLNNINSNDYYVELKENASGVTFQPSEGGIGVSMPSIPGVSKEDKSELNIKGHWIQFIELTDVAVSDIGITTNGNYSYDAKIRVKKQYKGRFKDLENAIEGAYNTKYRIPLRFIKWTPKFFDTKKSGQEASEKIKDFFSHEKNAIVRSFRSAGGEGLACVIESLAFDWGVGDGGRTFSVTPGSRGPMSVKVTMDISPIHDIAPGIDHNGFNRAFVYPVGNMAGKSVPPDDKKS
jgi:hypothetical protein